MTGSAWTCLDPQHGLMDYGDLTRLLRAISGVPITPLMRVAANQSDQKSPSRLTLARKGQGSHGRCGMLAINQVNK